LGTQWLATLDTHLVHYNQCFITFYLDGVITLQGDTSSQAILAQFNQFKRWPMTDAIAELYTLELSLLEESDSALCNLPVALDPDIRVLLHKYKTVFQPPHGLPPSRTHDHSIPLLPNTALVRVRPYRYPHS